MAETTTQQIKEIPDIRPPEELPSLIEVLYDKDKKILKLKIVRPIFPPPEKLEKIEFEEANILTTFKNINKIREMCLKIENTPIFDTAFNIILNTLKINPEELKFNKINEPPEPISKISLKNYIYQYKFLTYRINVE